MWNLNDVTQIEYKHGYSFMIVFDDNTNSIIDFSEYLDRGPIFAPLREQSFFRQARIEGGDNCMAKWCRYSSGNPV